MYPKNLASSELEWMMQNGQVDDAALLDALFNQYFPSLYRLGVFLKRDPEAAKNIAAQVLWRAVSERHRYPGDPGLKTWLYARLVKASRSIPGGSPISLLHPPSPNTSNLSSDLNPSASDSASAELSALDALDVRYQMVVFLRYAAGLSSADIAHILSMKESQVHQRLAAARQAAFQPRIDNSLKDQEHPDPSYIKDLMAVLDSAPAEDAIRLVNSLRSFGRPSNAPAAFDESLRRDMVHQMEGCPPCQAYANHLGPLEVDLARQLQAIWPLPIPSAAELQALLERFRLGPLHPVQRRRFTVSARELSIFAVVLLLVMVLRWASNSLPNSTNAAETPQALTSDSQQENPTSPPVSGSNARRIRPGSMPNTGSSNSNSLDLRGWVTSNRDSRLHVIDLSTLQLDKKPSSISEFNLSGPADLALLLRYWGWSANPASELQPNDEDRAVMPYELVSYVRTHTDLQAVIRYGGDLNEIQNFVDSGFPVLVEKSFEGPAVAGWVGRYEIVNGYYAGGDNSVLLTSYQSSGINLTTYYRPDTLVDEWRPFNYMYIVIYPGDLEQQVRKLLGSQVSETENYRYSAQKAADEIASAKDARNLFFAWFNRGSSLTYLAQYDEAGKAFDSAYAQFRNIPDVQRPWRIMWYQTRPYWAYFYAGRYTDVLRLAELTLATTDHPVLEESYYWRALAKEKLGDIPGAMADLRESLRINPNFYAGMLQLQRLNATGGGG